MVADSSAAGSEAAVTETGGAVYRQRFSVPYEYPVHFTEHLFAPHNPILRDTVRRIEADRRHRCIVFVDDGLVQRQARPSSAQIAAYAAAHADAIELVTAPITVPGGEKIKNELFHIEWMQGLLQEHRMDRHSFVIAIGGGAVLDAVGLIAATSAPRAFA